MDETKFIIHEKVEDREKEIIRRNEIIKHVNIYAKKHQELEEQKKKQKQEQEQENINKKKK